MDGDVIALGSLDSLYHPSMNGTLRENTEPTNGGIVMLLSRPPSASSIVLCNTG
jgi:hypothetical protein